MPGENGAQQPPEKNDASGRLNRILRTASFWAMLILIPVAILQLLDSGRRQQQTLDYTEFRSELASGNIQSIDIREGVRVEGRLKRSIQRGETSIDRFETLLPTEMTSELDQELRTQGVEIRARPGGNGWITLLVQVAPLVVILALFFFLFRQMQAGGARAFSFGKSRARLLSGDTPKVTFADVAGCDEAKEELEEIIEFLKDPQKFSRLGGRLPKGALLVGPPGTGKTLLARAVAGEAARPFFSMSGSDFVEMFVGVGASRVRDLFEQGKTHAPCIIFIDEIDAVGRHRGAGLGGGHDEREQTLNQLLVEMDGFESNEGVILLAATNRPDVLDPALLRPGRFDRQIVVDNPDIKGREGIFRVHTQDIPLAEDVDLTVLAKGTPGLSGADIENVVNEAALLAARNDKDRVYMDEFERAKDKVMLGSERRSMVISDEERRVTAYHEAGHAVVALCVPGLDPIHKITIVPRGRAMGITASLPEEDRHNYTKEWLEGQLKMLFGGRVAEELIFGESKITTGAGNDIERVTDLARRMVTQFGMSPALGPMTVGDREHEVFLGRDLSQRREVSGKTAELVDAEIKRILDESYAATHAILQENSDLLERIAGALLERETLDAGDAKLLLAGKPLPPMLVEPASPTREIPAAQPVAARNAPWMARAANRRPRPPDDPEIGAAAIVSAAVERRDAWQVCGCRIAVDRPLVVGILNVTPDSFSDGGRYLDPEMAADRAREMVGDGAGLIDVGAESTRPGAAGVAGGEEWARLEPVLRCLHDLPVPICVDTTKVEVAERALDTGAVAINNVSGSRAEPRMLDLSARTGAGLVLMHMRGTPRTMQENTDYHDVSDEVRVALSAARTAAVDAGCAPEQVALDPGIGFGKSVVGNLELIARLDELASVRAPIWIGPSRKSFLGALLQRPPEARLEGTIAACVVALERGARFFRVHDVAPVSRALAVAWAIETAKRDRVDARPAGGGEARGRVEGT